MRNKSVQKATHTHRTKENKKTLWTKYETGRSSLGRASNNKNIINNNSDDSTVAAYYATNANDLRQQSDGGISTQNAISRQQPKQNKKEKCDQVYHGKRGRAEENEPKKKIINKKLISDLYNN